MSFRWDEPKQEAVCECRHDAAQDEMDREDCPFHREPPEASESTRPEPKPAIPQQLRRRRLTRTN